MRQLRPDYQHADQSMKSYRHQRRMHIENVRAEKERPEREAVMAKVTALQEKYAERKRQRVIRSLHHEEVTSGN